jgi:hypothetical protein
MNTLKKLIAPLGLLSVLCAIPTMAQIANKVTFDAPSAFYAGNAKMPAGSYTITQPEADTNLLLIESDSGSHSVFVEYEVVSSNAPHAKSDVTFSKYGSVEFLSTIGIQGENSEMQIPPLRVEKNAAKAATADKHTLSAQIAGNHNN